MQDLVNLNFEYLYIISGTVNGASKEWRIWIKIEAGETVLKILKSSDGCIRAIMEKLETPSQAAWFIFRMTLLSVGL
jgi:hypothetical protein